MIPAAYQAALAATWPAAEYAAHGGLRVGRGMGGGGRVSSAVAVGDWTVGDLDAAEAQHAAWGQPALFAVDRADTALADALRGRGYRPLRPTLVLECDVAALAAQPVPPVTALEAWPPLAIQRGIWNDQGIGPARQAVMDRVAVPRISILGRVEDRAAGTAFVAVHDGIAMLHALAVLPRWRRRGLAGWMVRRAADFAARQGAGRLMLAVTEPNADARALYDRLGFSEAGRMDYWERP